MSKITNVKHQDINFTIEYEESPITHKDAWKRCGEGTWIYCSKRNSLERVSIGSHNCLPYSFDPNRWNSEGYHKVLSCSHPLWVWWREGCTKLKWEDINVALPKLEIK